VPKFAVKAAKESKNHLTITDGITELTKGGSHGFKAATIIPNGHRALTEVTKLSLKQ
jgi:hypothetical protein